MISRYITVITSCIALVFCSSASAETQIDRRSNPESGIVHAYRKPSEDDLRWLFNDTDAPKSGSGIVLMHCTVTDLAHPIVQMSLNRLPPPPEAPRELEITLPMTADMPNASSEPLPARGRRTQRASRTGCGDNRDDASPCWCLTCIISGNSRQNEKPKPAGCSTGNDSLDWMFQLDEAGRQCAAANYVPSMLGSSAWLPGYAAGTTGNPSAQFRLPTMLMSRPNVAEHFNADVQNRIWADFRHWNNAVSMNGESRGLEQFSFGLEKQFLQDNSLELRLPVFYQFASDRIDSSTSAELGNVSIFFKHVFSSNMHWTITYGAGAMLPTAQDWQPLSNVRLKNDVYYVVPFAGVQWHPDKEKFGQFVLQYDVPVDGQMSGQQVLRAGLQLGKWIYRTDHGKRPCRLGAFAEAGYALVIKGSPEYSISSGTDGIVVSSLDSRESALTLAAGMPMVFGKLTCTNSVFAPIPLGNYPFSIGYNFSLSRQF